MGWAVPSRCRFDGRFVGVAPGQEMVSFEQLPECLFSDFQGAGLLRMPPVISGWALAQAAAVE
jgi:hypothetical protein